MAIPKGLQVAKAEPDEEVPYASLYMGPIIQSLGEGFHVMEPSRFCAPPDPWCAYDGVKTILVRETSSGWQYVDTWPRRQHCEGANS
jgi:hypothetical protein